MKAVSGKSTNKGYGTKGPKDAYRSWDPLTQSKFLHDLHKELGTPISRAEAYRIARLLGHSSAEIEIPNMKSEAYRDTKGPGLPAYKRMMVAAADQSDIKAARDRAILRLLFDLALRASELVGLDLSHIDFEQKRISIKGKGRTERQFLSLPMTSLNALEDWIAVRGNDDGPLFLNLVRDVRKRKRLSRVGLYELIRGLGEDVQVRTRPHGIRHLSISEACNLP